jgi:hypothetical protein
MWMELKLGTLVLLISSTPVMVLSSFSIGLVMSFSMSTTELLLYGVPMNTSGVTTSGKLTLGITM